MKDDKLKTTFWQRLWANRMRWAYLLGALAFGIAGWFLGQLWAFDRSNVFVTTGVIACVVATCFLLYRGWRAYREVDTVIVGQEKETGPANSLNIYTMKDEDSQRILPKKLAFEMVDKEGKVVKEGASLGEGEHPPGQPWQCLNNGNWYYLNFFDLVASKLKPFILPDEQYFDPAEFANVISMPAHKKLFTERQSLFQQLAPGLMLLGFIASGFFCLVMGG